MILTASQVRVVLAVHHELPASAVAKIRLQREGEQRQCVIVSIKGGQIMVRRGQTTDQEVFGSIREFKDAASQE